MTAASGCGGRAHCDGRVGVVLRRQACRANDSREEDEHQVQFSGCRRYPSPPTPSFDHAVPATCGSPGDVESRHRARQPGALLRRKFGAVLRPANRKFPAAAAARDRVVRRARRPPRRTHAPPPPPPPARRGLASPVMRLVVIDRTKTSGEASQRNFWQLPKMLASSAAARPSSRSGAPVGRAGDQEQIDLYTRDLDAMLTPHGAHNTFGIFPPPGALLLEGCRGPTSSATGASTSTRASRTTCSTGAADGRRLRVFGRGRQNDLGVARTRTAGTPTAGTPTSTSPPTARAACSATTRAAPTGRGRAWC